ncbi:MAG: hypothetical protein WAX77_03705, partial [Methylococcaceae bacterium]
FIQRGAEPEILKNKGQQEQLTLCADYDNGTRKFNFKNDIYAHETVKSVLKTMQDDKCCYCEAKIVHNSYGDVEHFRPKAGYQQKATDKLSETGYYWLAYTWDNLLFSCTLCNQKHKKNLFPLVNPQNRACNHHDDINSEEPLLINPSKINPQEHISFRAEIPYAVNNSIYGKTTINDIGLDRESLNENRRIKLNVIIQLVDIIKLAKEQANNTELQQIATEIKNQLSDYILNTAEYSAMINVYLSTI